MTVKTFFAAAASAAAFIVAPAPAQDHVATTVSQTVTHADLDLSDRRHVARFDLRIRRAARELCGTPSGVDMAGRRKARQCADAAVARVSVARAAAIRGSETTMVAGR